MNEQIFSIDGVVIGGDHIFVIAEVGNNHNGSVELAKKLVDASIMAGADCVKFQLRNREALYRRKADGSRAEDLGVEYIQDLLDKVELTVDEHLQIRQYCAQKGISYICTPWDEPSVEVLADFDVPALKIASADLCNPYLIAKAAKLGKPLILSTGMSLEHEIVRAIEQLNGLGVPFALLHCNSTYPAPETDIQLGYLARLRELHGLIGYSGHERGTAISIAAVALGAKLIERHITLDRGMEGPDHLASLEPEEFRQLVEGIRQVEKALPWTGPGRHASQGELLNRENLGKSVIAARAIEPGEVFEQNMLRVASPGQGLPPYRLIDLLGKKAGRAIPQGDFLFDSDLSEQAEVRREFAMPILWGVPVRYHDFLQYEQWIKPDLFEFHLSYRDLSVAPQAYLRQVECSRLVVHAPELFENSELLDLVADDLEYRQRSIANLQRVVDATLQIAEFFPNADSLLIVANIGGFSADEPFPVSQRAELYRRFQESCAQVDFGRTELIPQNMAPFPWHFGGQRHQNIFMMPQELAEQAKALNLRLCLDLSHLQMACFHFGLDFQAALALLLPHSAHLHVADAKGSNGEGVIMGTGDVDWPATWAQLKAYPQVSFIPEVWQGHKDHGAGFWSALDFLNSLNVGSSND
ncbi:MULTISPECIES: N-acetylneuraminate synthase family protein [unclassified Pseudomonas]|jgi:Sialic acid synthase|uniref:N-acetylneuraminate synthase family protein n=1 Tax=unclassified Pseudomonas TaxID=196821 RepID=UPI000C87CA29|nr:MULTISPECIES: N-acetylneuraminate synthase family protein [unclassified Pseudomonas]PMU10355.1 acetylneuraminic acid synthetase [Pseudomonas sp. FW305-20]PMU16639.1 acetylneuraminic acid synthetase [Pseudomonas sp. FW305-122]PMU40413.1 acetylneuraminic acid synthetase [Pseudomonas sp. FW305-47B]PMX60633.1 acetylneuraminic acid synthetase [Pseudomonas sp. FW305-33]PMX66974.1 acetylneuraminic acid synthetase [Pseudomonas sp. FW305-60]